MVAAQIFNIVCMAGTIGVCALTNRDSLVWFAFPAILLMPLLQTASIVLMRKKKPNR